MSKIRYGYSKIKTVENFWKDKETKKDLSDGMKDIYSIIKDIAINDLDEPEFIRFYWGNPEKKGLKFSKGFITKIKENNKEIGFLYATFYENDGSYVNPAGQKPTYVAKAFHAVAHDYRQSKSYDRTYLHRMFINFYIKEIFEPEFFKEIDNFIENSAKAPRKKAGIYVLSNRLFKKLMNLARTRNIKLPQNVYADDIGDNNLKSIRDKVIKKLQANSSPLLTIEIMAENPTTYKDMCLLEPDHTTVNRNPKGAATAVGSDEWLKVLTNRTIIQESFKLYNDYENSVKPRPNMLVKAEDFKVNINNEEWLKSFNIERKRNNKAVDMHRRFYMWQNFSFPDWAFLMIIPISPNLVDKSIKAINKKSMFALRKLGIEGYGIFLLKEQIFRYLKELESTKLPEQGTIIISPDPKRQKGIKIIIEDKLSNKKEIDAGELDFEEIINKINKTLEQK